MLFLMNVFSVLSYMSQQYSEVMVMRPSIIYTPFATSSKEKNTNIIMFTYFEEGGLISETRSNAVSGDKSYDK